MKTKQTQIRKPQLSIRTTPHHKYLITGRDPLGRSIRIATFTRIGAEKVVAAVKQGNHAAVDSILINGE